MLGLMGNNKGYSNLRIVFRSTAAIVHMPDGGVGFGGIKNSVSLRMWCEVKKGGGVFSPGCLESH